MKTDINNYFKNIWKPNIDNHIHSGWKLLKYIDIREDVLDVGCGYNLFKKYLPNLYGIDPANDNADEVVSIENYITNKKYDVILCLGSINFGQQSTIELQIEKVIKLLRPGGRIYWRQNPGKKDHKWKECLGIDFFPWTIKKNYELANKYDCKVRVCKWDRARIYAEWNKKIH